MIIGIHGKMSSGKDTLAKMFHFLFTFGDCPFSEYNESQSYDSHLIKIRRFAGPLKQIVSVLIGCKIEDLEKEEFKNSIAVGWERPISQALDWLRLWGMTAEMTDDKIVQTATAKGFKWERTYREILQEVGTDLFRNHFDINTWTKSALATYSPKETWLMPDLRFPNEGVAILEREGILIKITRPGLTENQHVSETALDKYNYWHYVIENDAGLEQLYNKTLSIYNQIQHDRNNPNYRKRTGLDNPVQD